MLGLLVVALAEVIKSAEVVAARAGVDEFAAATPGGLGGCVGGDDSSGLLGLPCVECGSGVGAVAAAVTCAAWVCGAESRRSVVGVCGFVRVT
ncbi:hypothetical protein ABW16_21470 [Mycolicibacter heraklionensis]|uniref:Secreted protein n=1 Tax=Mycolicibacter heraklionensis TaxID=512402 RepID=A0ABR5FA15_9MYCO|nr:hypothetical protein ABW16_21470 [Mycolicibacter heraklionensis]